MTLMLLFAAAALGLSASDQRGDCLCVGSSDGRVANCACAGATSDPTFFWLLMNQGPTHRRLSGRSRGAWHSRTRADVPLSLFYEVNARIHGFLLTAASISSPSPSSRSSCRCARARH
jgi:hypothetical protein